MHSHARAVHPRQHRRRRATHLRPGLRPVDIVVFALYLLLLALAAAADRRDLIWFLALSGSVVVPVQVIRARREDHVLADAFGAEYDAYRRSGFGRRWGTTTSHRPGEREH